MLLLAMKNKQNPKTTTKTSIQQYHWSKCSHWAIIKVVLTLMEQLQLLTYLVSNWQRPWGSVLWSPLKVQRSLFWGEIGFARPRSRKRCVINVPGESTRWYERWRGRRAGVLLGHAMAPLAAYREPARWHPSLRVSALEVGRCWWII